MKKAVQRIVNRAKAHRWLTLGLVVMLLTLGFLGYRQHEIRQEKQRFEQARASIDELYKEIVATAGEPDKSERSESCGYAARKFDRGPRSCLVNTKFVYGVKDNEDATEKFRKIKEAVENRSDIFYVTFSNESDRIPFLVLEEMRDDTEVGTSIRDNKTQFECSMRTVYANRGDDTLPLMSDVDVQNLAVSVSCIDDAKAEHYPVIDS